MNTTRRRAVAVVLAFVLSALSMLAISGCDDDDPTGIQPEFLIGTWAEIGYDRQMVLEANDDFLYRTVDAPAPKGVEGVGTWEGTDDELTIHLRAGRFQWLESTNNAPISFTFTYTTALDTLELTFDIMGTVSTARYVPVN